jgi:hypothetical protein
LDETNVFHVLKVEDIDDKIALNIKKHGYSLKQFRDLLAFEMFLIQRDLLKTQWLFSKSTRSHQELLRETLPLSIQIQNLTEQIFRVDQIMRDELERS